MRYFKLTCFTFFVIVIFILFPLNKSFSQSNNRLNKQGHRTGKWVTYIDEPKKLKSFEGRFKDGVSVGKCYFYNNDGVLDRREINRFNKMKTTFYFPNGKVKLKGNARLENLPDRIHYYFYGRWRAYNDSGKIVKYCYYEQGKLLKTVYLDKNNKTNDSLIEALNVIDKEFTIHNNILADSINASRPGTIKNSSKHQYFKNKLQQQDSLSFVKIEQIINSYGYPSKQIAGESNEIPFYILGFAPLTIKEKHLNELILAADRGNISWKSLAFFIDKIKVAKGEKQIYGTQGTYDKDYNFIYYPVSDPENINKIRVLVGLDEL